MKRSIVYIIALFVCSISLTSYPSNPVKNNLDKPIDKNDLLYFKSFGDISDPNKTIVIYLHGDTGHRKVGSYMVDEASNVAESNSVIGVAILRPGVADKHGNRSPGVQDASDDNKTPQNNAAVANTIKYLKGKYKASRVVGVGHSGGSIMLASIIGLYPNLLDAVVLASTVCDIPPYRIKRKGVNRWTRSQSAKNYAQNISPDTVIRIITGELDGNTLVEFAKDCEAVFKKYNLNVKTTIVKGGTHKFRTIRSVVRGHVDDLL